jgi:hypothetical protein
MGRTCRASSGIQLVFPLAWLVGDQQPLAGQPAFQRVMPVQWAKKTRTSLAGFDFDFWHAFAYKAECRRISQPVRPGSFLLRTGEIRFNVRRELLQVEQLLVQDPLDNGQVDLQIAMHQNVS